MTTTATISARCAKSYVSGFLSDPSNQTSTNQGYDGNWLWQNTLNYKLDLGQHRLEFLAGHETIKYMSQSFFASRQRLCARKISITPISTPALPIKTMAVAGLGYACCRTLAKSELRYAGPLLCFRNPSQGRFFTVR